MAWSDFKFARDQRVLVPGTDGIQGIVTARVEFKNAESRYEITYLDNDLTQVVVEASEPDLARAQPAIPVRIDRKPKRKAKTRAHVINWNNVKRSARIRNPRKKR